MNASTATADYVGTGRHLICNCGHGFEPDTRPININKTLKSFALLLEAMVSEDLTSRLSDITPLPPFFRT